MPYGVASPKQLRMMSKVLDEYCSAHGIKDAEESEDIGLVILDLFNTGHRTADEIRAGLEKRQRQWIRVHGGTEATIRVDRKGARGDLARADSPILRSEIFTKHSDPSCS
jgi:hypothetical protein